MAQKYPMKQLYIRTSNEYLEEWDKERIVSALIRETYIDRRTAETISNEVEKQIIGLNITILTSTLIRELVSAKLIEFGLEKAHKMHTRLGVPLYDVEQIILQHGTAHPVPLPGPELTNLALAQRIKREYALINVFSQEVADAHRRGDLYLEGLEFIDRLYCVGLSLEYLKKFGLSFFESAIKAKPAKHPEALISQMIGFTEILRGLFFSSLEWDAVNVLFAPYTDGLPNSDLKQLAQKLVFELARQSMSLRVATLLNLYWQVPAELSNVPVIGALPKTSKRSKKVYKDYQNEAQRFLLILLEVLLESNTDGCFFALPLAVIHLSDDFFQAPDSADFLKTLAEFILRKGHLSIVFEREQQRRIFRSFVSPPKNIELNSEPWKTRHAIINSVCINLPRFGYVAYGSDMHLFAKLTEMMELTAEAHMQKRVFIEKLLAAGREGPLGVLMMKQDGESFLKLEQADFLIGFVGLNELVQIHKGSQFHESDDAISFGLEIIAHMESVCERLSQRHHISFLLTGLPNPGASSRLARLDLRYYSPDSGHVIKGDLGSGHVHYTDSMYMNSHEDDSPLQRMKHEGAFCRYLSGGSVSHVSAEGHLSQRKGLVEFINAVYRTTETAHIYFSPDNSSKVFNYLN
ncbi:anaerobic ribonucleoside-triphosphate reductase [candidate division KSB3 bacterium]|uniref:Anaerobic ribonucleoside-triphosphate reductase n=1 Tax=candidate division KSB3 bacterium TaxID=2044937 RepID=A0A2G6E7I8_9BACT|nr:MAG: anaerobic ribonucleoside-triphosphate reductase [candidate division KSB3 bacterium]PIE30425.1 MAG: anaerobic ribonucleoside-triphosphate reductase [candidate division KSB3 bacterium]